MDRYNPLPEEILDFLRSLRFFSVNSSEEKKIEGHQSLVYSPLSWRGVQTTSQRTKSVVTYQCP